MGKRLDLQAILKQITANVYFQPPSSVTMQYPCIVYQRDDADTKFADDSPYSYTQRYQVTLIDRNPDSTLFDAIRILPLCRYDRSFATEGLNHDVFNLYF